MIEPCLSTHDYKEVGMFWKAQELDPSSFLGWKFHHWLYRRVLTFLCHKCGDVVEVETGYATTKRPRTL